MIAKATAKAAGKSKYFCHLIVLSGDGMI